MNSILPQLLLQVILIFLNAFFAAAEIAVISLNASKLRKSAEDGDKTCARLLKLVEEPSGFLSTIQIGITLAGFLGSCVCRGQLFRLSGRLGIQRPGISFSPGLSTGYTLRYRDHHYSFLFHTDFR